MIFFTSVAHSIVPTNPSHDTTSSNNDRILSDCFYDIPYVTENFVAKEIDEMPCRKASGVDEISCKILKIAKNIIVPSLTEIINLSIRTKSVPNLWKQAKVTPIFKSVDRNDVKYQIIDLSLSCQFYQKVFERAVFNLFYSYLTKFNIVCENQSGFRPKHSYCTPFLKLVNELAS